MKKMLCVAAFAACSLGLQGFALAQTKAADTKAPEAKVEAKAEGGSCEDKAVGKDGKKLAGAAKTSFVKKCEAENKPACEAKAVGKDGKKLAGAAKTSFIKKCEAEAAH